MANLNSSTNTMSSTIAASRPPAVRLANQERQLIANFRAMKPSARDMLLDVSEEIAEALPDNVEPEVKQ